MAVRILHRLDEVLATANDAGDLFATACAGAIRGSRAEVACAGHPAPVLLDACPREADVRPDRPLGIAGPATWRTAAVDLPPGGLLLYTDGLSEARMAPSFPDRVGAAGVLDLAGRYDVAADRSGVARLLDDVLRAAGRPHDDTTILVIGREGPLA